MKKSSYIRRSQSEWQSLIDTQNTSGLSAKSYCEKQGISYASFCAWRRRLNEPASGAPLVDLSMLANNATAANWHSGGCATTNQ